MTPLAPRDRLQQLGPRSLATSELLAVVLGTGVTSERATELADRLIGEYGNLIGLARLDLAQLAQVPGVGLAKASQIQAVIELGRRLTMEASAGRLMISSPADAARLLLPEMAHLEQEHLRVMFLDTRNQVLGMHEVYKGSLNTSMVRVAEVFREAIRRNSAAIIIAHNHPSGTASPSTEDVLLTRRVVEAGELLDIPLLDHLVIGHGEWVSLKERGLGFG